MNRKTLSAVALVLLLSGAAWADTSAFLAETAKKSDGALAIVRYTIQNQVRMGPAICIDPEGLFLTFAIEPGMQQAPKTASGPSSAPAAGNLGVESLELVVPGVDGQAFDAQLVSTDVETGIAFVRDLERKHKWQAFQFADKADLKIGQELVSVGLMSGDPAFATYYGTGFVSAEIRVPDRLVYVTGGKLTGPGSIVLNEAGKAVGLVFPQQPFLSYQAMVQQGSSELRLVNRQEREFFMPVDEFAHVLKNPSRQRVLPWIGVLEFRGDPKGPGVILGRVLAGQIADKAGLKDGDVVLQLNGQPVEKLATPELTGQAFVKKLIRLDPGQKISLTAKTRQGETWTEKVVELTLEPEPKGANAAPKYLNVGLGLLVRDKVLLDRYLLQGRSQNLPGVLVMGVVQGSLAEALQAGDLITAADGKDVADVVEFKKAAEAAIVAGRPVNLIVWRGDTQLPVVTITVPKPAVSSAPAAPAAPSPGRP